jgi:hypothetical protein
VCLICHTKVGKDHLKRNYTGIMNSPFVLSFKADVCDNKVSVKQPLLEAAGGWNKKQIIGVNRENCKGSSV